ncbi:hypothetical protein CPBF426_27470 [Xanthomonas arboricola pv. juglandis]|nr:hypothetical protein CPBF426_27470 [Xanthomonas arboricola pv. juglandis]
MTASRVRTAGEGQGGAWSNDEAALLPPGTFFWL